MNRLTHDARVYTGTGEIRVMAKARHPRVQVVIAGRRVELRPEVARRLAEELERAVIKLAPRAGRSVMSDESKVDPMTCPLAVGDRVEVVGPSWSGYTDRVGEITTTRLVERTGFVWLHQIPNSSAMRFPRSSLRLVEPEPAKVSPAPNSPETPESSPSATGEEWMADNVHNLLGVGIGSNNLNRIATAHNASLARLAAAHRAEVERVRAEERERCAKVVEPKRKRPCDCTSCDCGNVGSAQCVAEWDQAASIAAEIRAMKCPTPLRRM